jgi:site-specific DNA-methyltransferase (adenine-specific)
VLFQSQYQDYETPAELFLSLDAEFHFTIDVAAAPHNAKCPAFYTREQDALGQTWTGTCFLNPPFGDGYGPASQTERGRIFGAWLKKAAESAKAGATVVALIPARTDTHWFHDYVLPFAELRFIRGRQRFPRPGNAKTKSATFPSLVAVYRPEGSPP